jgi:hypothetical protein
LKDDFDVNATRGAGAPGADLPRLLAMADAVAKGVRPSGLKP